MSAILFSRNSLAFFEAVFKESSPVSNNCSLHFLANDKNPHPLIYFLVPGSTEYLTFLFINEQCQINFIFYF